MNGSRTLSNCFTDSCAHRYTIPCIRLTWWIVLGSNQWPLRCQRSIHTAEITIHICGRGYKNRTCVNGIKTRCFTIKLTPNNLWSPRLESNQRLEYPRLADCHYPTQRLFGTPPQSRTERTLPFERSDFANLSSGAKNLCYILNESKSISNQNRNCVSIKMESQYCISN